MDTLTITRQTAQELKRLAEKRRRADLAAEDARAEFIAAVELARKGGATLEEIGEVFAVSRQRVHQWLNP